MEARSKYKGALQKHNARSTSLTQRFEAIYKDNGITREHYHGSKFNGMNCIRIMSKAKKLFLGDDNLCGGFLEACLILLQQMKECEPS